METDAAFVRADGAVHLYAETAVYMNLTFVIHPWNTEHYYSLGLNHTLHDLLIQEVRVLKDIGGNALYNLTDCLMEFLLTGILGHKFSHELVNVILYLLIHNAMFCIFCEFVIKTACKVTICHQNQQRLRKIFHRNYAKKSERYA